MTGGSPDPVLIQGIVTIESFPRAAAAVFRDGRIASIETYVRPGMPPAARAALEGGARNVDGRGSWLLPGWIDLQVNDIDWLAGGLRASAEHARRIRDVLRHQVERGVTGIILATLAAPLAEIEAYLEGIAAVRAGGGPWDAALHGGLVEGTFMNPAFCGAHNPAHVHPPDPDLIERLLATGGVRAMNLAPEMSEDSIEIIRSLARRGILVGCGHARPSGALVREAVEAGLAYTIHLGNGPTGSSLKGFGDGGLMEEALRNDRLAASLILDGFHIDRRLARDIIARKEVARVVGISDAGFAMGPPAGEFEVFGIRGESAAGGRWLRVLPDPGAPASNPRASDPAILFGSAVGMREVFENALNWLSVEMEGIYHRRHLALDFREALRAVAQITSANPARLFGLSDRGRLAPGLRADAVLAGIKGDPGTFRVEVLSTWLGGREVPAPEAGQTPSP